VTVAAKKASVNGRRVFVGIGGLQGRPDLLRKLVHATLTRSSGESA